MGWGEPKAGGGSAAGSPDPPAGAALPSGEGEGEATTTTTTMTTTAAAAGDEVGTGAALGYAEAVRTYQQLAEAARLQFAALRRVERDSAPGGSGGSADGLAGDGGGAWEGVACEAFRAYAALWQFQVRPGPIGDDGDRHWTAASTAP